MIYHQPLPITKNMPVSSLGMLGIKKPMLQSKRPFFHKTLFWKILIWLFVGSCLLVIASSEARAASCAGGVCHVRSTTIDFTVSSDDLTASTVIVNWEYQSINGTLVTVSYTPDPVDETAGATIPPNPPNVAWMAGPLYPTAGSGGAITQTHTFHGVLFTPPNGFCANSITKTIGLAHVTISDTAGNQTTTDFLIVYDCDQVEPPICRTSSSHLNQCDGGCTPLNCTPTPISLGDSLQVYGYCSDVNTGIYLQYKLYCVKEDGTLFASPFYSRDLQCNNLLDSPDSLTAGNEIYIKKPPDDPLCKSYELQACQAVGQNASSCAWYKWRYNFDIQPWLQVKGGSIRSEGQINLKDKPPTGQCNATYTITANGQINKNTAKNNNCSNVEPVVVDVKGGVTSTNTSTKSSRGVIDIASILKGRFGKVTIINTPTVDFSSIKAFFASSDVVVLNNPNGVTVNIGSTDTMDNAGSGARGNKTILVQSSLTLASADGSLSYQAGNVASPNQLASLGWIIQGPNPAIKTNLTIDRDISNLAGVFYVNGDIHTGDTSAKALTVQGAMVTSNLGTFDFQRTYANTTVASETIWDDGRAWLNPPPGFVNILSGLPHSTSLKVSPNN